MSERGLRDKTVSGVAWSGIDNVLGSTVSFLVTIVLARIVSPDDYGLLGIIGIFTVVSQTIVIGGFGNALIRKKNPTEDDYHTVFLMNLSVSIVLYLVLFFSAPAISRFFNMGELISLTRVSSVGIVLAGLSLVQRVKLTKRLDFKTQTTITLITSISSGIVGIAMAIGGFGVWALVAQHIFRSFMDTVLLWVFNKWIPRIRFSKESFKELFGYSWKILLSSLLNQIWGELYQLVVAKFYSPATLGQYTRSKGFAQLFSTNLTNVVQRVSFPVLSDIQDEKNRLISVYREIIKVTMFVTAVCMFGVGAIAEPLLYCLIGPKWHEAATYLPLICVSMSLYPLQAINLNMLQVQGRSDLFLILEIIKKVISIGPLAVLIFVGIRPMLWSNILFTIICFFLNSFYTGKSLGYTSWMQLKDIAPSYGIATLLAVSVYFFKYIPISFWVILPIQIVLGALILFVVCEWTKFPEFISAKNIVVGYLSKIRRH